MAQRWHAEGMSLANVIGYSAQERYDEEGLAAAEGVLRLTGALAAVAVVFSVMGFALPPGAQAALTEAEQWTKVHGDSSGGCAGGGEK
jgi:hypothetical protein